MSENQIDSDKGLSSALSNFIKKHLFLFVSIIGITSLIFIIEYYPLIADRGSQILAFCEKCLSIFNEII